MKRKTPKDRETQRIDRRAHSCVTLFISYVFLSLLSLLMCLLLFRFDAFANASAPTGDEFPLRQMESLRRLGMSSPSLLSFFFTPHLSLSSVVFSLPVQNFYVLRSVLQFLAAAVSRVRSRTSMLMASQFAHTLVRE